MSRMKHAARFALPLIATVAVVAAGPSCNGSAEDEPCDGHKTLCNGQCVDTIASDAHCGACGHACLPGQSCIVGQCVGTPTAGPDGGAPPDSAPACSPGLALCGAACVDLQTSPEHCGACESPCGPDEVCDGGSCSGLPATCPPEGCPKGSYCDLGQQRCVAGCLEDSGCGGGQICEGRKCIVGCREDVTCPTGQICDDLLCRAGCRNDTGCATPGTICELTRCIPGCRNDTQCPAGQICEGKQCRAGCRDDGDCPGQICDQRTLTCRDGCRDDKGCTLKETICDTAKAECVPGCHGDEQCNPGRICEGTSCRDGCRTHDNCALETYCHPTELLCKPGCNQLKERCPVGKACVLLTSGATECREACYSYTCNGDDYTCFTPIYDYSPSYQAARCRKKCSADGDCDTGYKCIWFRTQSSIYSSDAVKLCAKPCSVTNDCSTAVPNLNPAYVEPCACDTTEDVCKVNGTGTLCYERNPSYGL